MYRFTILGCGSSGGVPRLGGDWGDCDPANPKNRRRRCSMLVERLGTEGVTRVLIDTAPDMRDQLLDAGVGTLDAVAYTHSHADHTHGIDDLRQIVFNLRRRLRVWADGATQSALIDRFGYAFVQPADSPYPPILDLHTIHDAPFTIEGAGGPVTLTPFRADHGSIEALGFRIGGLAYLPDAVKIPEDSWPVLAGLQVFVVDALRRKPHPTHAHLALALDWIARAAPARAVLTNMHLDLDHATLCAELPAHITPAHDGMQIELAA
ncbi:MAG TPA: phosphoribosyl 1,2-cyclic phosphodiesterase [Gemmobacter sp.]|nr:MAG: phosphoribosyl 1,2-cyclic phosphodiesterase [Rhodobacteraceae bacterium GWF1_65_7]HBD91005.1 phosphoribosyl 1,2-cyclic phosphodiesterase [Gemmobacter sp.]